ncbi:hypothetical protein HN873_026685, partial [Arachis hypogaea]
NIYVYTNDILSTYGKDGALLFFLGKITLFSPNSVLEYKVPVYKAVKNVRRVCDNLPRTYHVGFSH